MTKNEEIELAWQEREQEKMVDAAIARGNYFPTPWSIEKCRRHSPSITEEQYNKYVEDHNTFWENLNWKTLHQKA